MLFVTVKSYKATKGDELSVAIGAVVEVLQKSDSGWWLIRYGCGGAKDGALGCSDLHRQRLRFVRLPDVHCPPPLLIRSNNKVGYVPTMSLQPYNHPQIRMNAGHRGTAAAAALSGFQQRSNKLSSSQANLLQLPPAGRSPSPQQQQPHADGRQRSRSLNYVLEPPPAQPSTATANGTSTPKQAPPPTITVDMDGAAGRGRSPTVDSEGSYLSDSTDFSFSDSDELQSSRGSSSLNLSVSSSGAELLRSRTPPPSASNHHLRPSVPDSKMNASVSDPNIYKGPLTPKIPPRPQAREILARCTTITRKNASRGSPVPTQTGMLSR